MNSTKTSAFKLFLLWLIIITLISCGSQKDLVSESPSTTIEETEAVYEATVDTTEERTLDELVVTAPRDYVLPVYRAANERKWDLIHMDLDVRFDWIKEHVIGRADLLMRPYFYDQTSVILDAKGFDIHDVADASGKTLTYEYDGKKLKVLLGQTYTREEDLMITIDYVAKPSEGGEGGSAAITSDKGLFFIDPRDEDPEKPTQIWTQGETEHNSRWFPTIDSPNENMTHKISITVENKYVTLSNGELVSSRPLGEKRTDTWVMDQPHAPYLVMVAVGEFAVVRETVDGLPYEYYVEKAYEPYAKQIFAHTPEMMAYFSDKLDFPYPWNKYSQIITRDYVSGAMENTTAVIFGEFIQKTDRELIDDNNDYIVAHEMFHHWFGDLVTCESWANLTLQEGFANYSEHLWQEHKYGQDAADAQRLSEKEGYLGSIMMGGIHPLIHYGYGDKEEMFDGHSYNKGGLVLHMLRHEIGDEAFWAGLNKYLTDHQHTAVEVDELRMAFEDVTGRDLQWFFDQWYLSAGHPELEIAYDYDAVAQKLKVLVNQTQDPEAARPIFILPVGLSVYDQDGKETQFDITIDARNYELELDYPSVPVLILFDRSDDLLFTKQESKTQDEYARQYQWADAYIHRREAIDHLAQNETNAALFIAALDDGHHTIRKIAVDQLDLLTPGVLDKLKTLAVEDPHSVVRTAAISKLNIDNDPEILGLVNQALEDRSYKVVAAALRTLNGISPTAALAKAEELRAEDSDQLIGSIADVYASTGDTTYVPFFEDNLTSVDIFSSFAFYDAYLSLISQLSPDQQLELADRLYEIGRSGDDNIYYRFNSTVILYKLQQNLSSSAPEVSQKLAMMVDDIKKNETNPQLLQQYALF